MFSKNYFFISASWILSVLLLSIDVQAESVNFTQILVDDHLQDGYWIEAFDVNNDGRPDLVTSGLAIGEVAWYENPGEFTEGTVWQKRTPESVTPKWMQDVRA
jgi:hypothetical protein